MAESLLFAVVHDTARKAADVLVQNMTRMCGVEDDRRKLERQLLAVQCKLADAESRSETNRYVKRWMKDLRTVAYEAADVLDDFQYEALRREARIGESTTRKVLDYFTPHSALLFRLTMSRKLHDVLEKINQLVEEMNKFGLVERTEPPQLLYRQTHSGLDDSAGIFGRDGDKESVVNLLLDQRDQLKVHVLPIFGMGGLGKTTLAKMVYNDGSVQQHFQLNMWHCVSENFGAIDLVKSVIELATQKNCDLPNTIELLRGRLQEVIGQKRFLLVLDDVWNEEKRKWEDDLKPLLCSVGGPGSVILVTCRSRQVASIMSTLGPHELECLSEDDSWELFSEKAFSNGVEEQAELATIGRRIVKKCRGLPLALKTIGGLMSSKQQVQEWEAIAESNIGDNARGKDEIISILKLSYRHLSPEMKQCFAFCSVFYKDCEMEKDMLIQLWIANGFIQEEGTMDLSQKGEFIFHYLVWRSFLQDVKLKEARFSGAYKVICCKMHDLMHDLAKDVTDECATMEDLIQQRASIKDARHMQIITPGQREQFYGLFKGTTYLHTLLGSYARHKNLKELRLISVRALHSYVPSIIHYGVINAKHLRYLDLSESGIGRLPDSICVLYNLQSLRLNGCWKLRQLPEDMSNMRKLIHLYLFGCDGLERMPPKLSLLNNLHTLTTFVVDTGDGRGIEELKDLQHLANRLELYNLRKVKGGENAKEANLHEKQNLRELLLYWGRCTYDQSEHEACNEEQVLDCLAPHCKLQILNVAGYNGLKVSQWMRDPQMFLCLRKLKISNCPRCKDLPVVWLSVSLEYMCLESMGGLTTLGKSIGVEEDGYKTHLQIFPRLKVMALNDLPSLDRWMENSAGEPINYIMFPMLEVLSISCCPKIASVPESPVLKNLHISGHCSPQISSLAHLTTLSELKYFGNDIVSTSMPLGSWPSLNKLQVGSLANMMMVPLEDQHSQNQTRALETLRSLSLYWPKCFVTPSRLSRSHLGHWECFAFVEELTIHSSNELVLWPMEELRILSRLRSLCIFFCANLEGKGSLSEESLPLPQLESLDIRNCHNLAKIPKLPTSLEQLKIFDCENLVELPSNLEDLAKLRVLDVNTCRCLKALPDGMDGLTSLEQLRIGYCPGITEFPQGLLQRLPVLKSLCISTCPELQRRCREGGEYFHLLSSIPEKSIRYTETESSSKNFLRRLIPSCQLPESAA